MRTFTRSLAGSLTVALSAVGVLLGLAAWQDWNLIPLTTLLIAVGAAIVLALLITLFTDSSLERTARLLEASDPELHARFSTALEVAQTGETATPVRQALLKDAEQHADSLRPAERVSLRLQRGLSTGLLGGLTLLAAGVLLTEPLNNLPRTVPQAVQTRSNALADDEQEALASNLQQLADLFADRDADGTDAYLQAISRQLQELGERMVSEDMNRDEVAGQLERLLQHTQSAIELQESPERRSDLEDLPDLLQAALRDVEGTDQTTIAEDAQRDSLENEQLAADSTADADNGQDAQEVAAQPPSLEELLEVGSQDTGDSQAQGVGNEQPRSSGSYYDHAIDERTIAELNQRALEQSLTQAAGEAIGASSESEAGASSLAGEGSDDLFGSEEAANLNAERLEQMAVPEETDPEGRRVRVEVTPEAELTEVRITPLGQMTWSRTTESAVEREAITTSQRLVTARYHTPEQTE